MRDFLEYICDNFGLFCACLLGFGVLFGGLGFATYHVVQNLQAKEREHEAVRREVANACHKDPDYLGCRTRWLDARGLTDPSAPKSGGSMPIVIPVR